MLFTQGSLNRVRIYTFAKEASYLLFPSGFQFQTLNLIQLNNFQSERNPLALPLPLVSHIVKTSLSILSFSARKCGATFPDTIAFAETMGRNVSQVRESGLYFGAIFRPCFNNLLADSTSEKECADLFYVRGLCIRKHQKFERNIKFAKLNGVMCKQQ